MSEGVLKACKFLGLILPPSPLEPTKDDWAPSDYFGENFELDAATMEKLQINSELERDELKKIYEEFAKKFSSQKPLKKNKTNLNVYFCDFMFSAQKKFASPSDYFDFEFYKKSEEVQNTFRTQCHRWADARLCNDSQFINLLDNKAKTNTIFAQFVHRDWLDTKTCSFEEFKNFVGKHPRFFSKFIVGYQGKGAEIVKVDSNENLEELFNRLKAEKRILEELIRQHESLAAFCPDTVNTIRVNTFLDVHNCAHIMTTSGRFGRIGSIVDNFHCGGFSAVIDPKTGIIISDGLSQFHERVERHPDTGKIFKGFQYPFWKKFQKVVLEMQKAVPRLRHIGWDITINSECEIELVEANARPDVDVQQAPDDVGKIHIFKPFLDELKEYQANEMTRLGWRVKDITDFRTNYVFVPSRKKERLKFAVSKLVSDCESVMELGCRKSKFFKTVCPEKIKYFPVDFENYGDEEIIVCDFNQDEFPEIKADVCFSAFTAEYVENLPQFLTNMCNATQKQILMWSRPYDKDIRKRYRWQYPFLTDFTEKFLVDTMRQNNFRLHSLEIAADNECVILYDFRKIESLKFFA